jgi:hypothetical protein
LNLSEKAKKHTHTYALNPDNMLTTQPVIAIEKVAVCNTIPVAYS